MSTTEPTLNDPLLADLAAEPISEAIRRLAASRRSGDLQVRSDKIAKMVFFDQGRPVFAASNVRHERLGEALLARGRISGRDFERASAIMQSDNGTRFGDALVKAGVMRADEVGGSVALWVESILVSLFDLQRGVMLFEERECSIPAGYAVKLSVDRVLRMGIESMSNRDMVLAGLGPLDRKVVVTRAPRSSFDVDGWSAQESEILALAEAPVTLRDLVGEETGVSFPRLRVVYALLASGILEEAAPAAIPAPPALTPARGIIVRDTLREEVDKELLRSEGLDIHAWLNVPATTYAERIVRLLEGKRERYNVLREAATDEDLRTDIELILGRAALALRLARRMLGEQTQPRTGLGS